MTVSSHLNYDTYRRKVEDRVEQHPELAVALVQRDFPRLVELAEELQVDELVTRIHFDVHGADITEYSIGGGTEKKHWDEEELEVWEEIEENPHEAVQVYSEMEDEGFEMDWVSAYDAEKTEIARIADVQEMVAQYNSRHKDRSEYDRRTITFPNEEMAVVWMKEITGQISDGAWENAPQTSRDGWKDWCYARIKVDERKDEVELEGPSLQAMDFSPYGKLGEHEEMFARMIYYVRTSGFEEYGEEDLKEDLKTLNEGL